MKVHADTFASKAFEGKSASKYPYKDSVVEVDAYIGEIVKALEDAGVLENTFIFVTSDNGPQMDSLARQRLCAVPRRQRFGLGRRHPRAWHRLLERHDFTGPRKRRTVRPDGPVQYVASIWPARPDKIPTDRYIDGIDQTSFLLADDGRSLREKVYVWNERDLMAMRMLEYKIHVKVVQSHAQWLDIDMTTVSDVGLAPWVFNLYIDPKEQYPVGHRMNAWLASMAAELKVMRRPSRNIRLKILDCRPIGTAEAAEDGTSALPSPFNA